MSRRERALAALPWSVDGADQRRYRASFAICLLLLVLLSVAIPLITLPERTREEVEALPPQLTRLIVEKQKPPAPAVQTVEESKPELEPASEPEPESIPEPEPVPEPQPVPKSEPVPQPEPATPAPVQTVVQAREKARSSGLLALKDQLSDLREISRSRPNPADSEVVSATVADAPAGSNTPSELKLDTSATAKAEAEAGVSGKASELDGRKVTQIALSEKSKAGEVATARAKPAAGRSREEIRRVFDANKSTIFRIYQRELRKNPALRGTVVPELTIEPNGAVSRCRIVKSDLGSPDLEAKICSMLQLMEFDARTGIDQYVVPYPIDLIPG